MKLYPRKQSKHWSFQQIQMNISMKLKFNHKLLLIFLLLVISNVNAQKASLVFSKSMLSKTGKIIVFELSDSSGVINPSAEQFNQAEMIYFLAKPQQEKDWTLSRKDAEKKLSEIKLIQASAIIQTAQPKLLTEGDAVKGVILSFPKSKVSLIKEMKFKLEEVESESISIPEKLWPRYKIYNEIITVANSAATNGAYLIAFKNLSKFWCKDSLLTKYSFYLSTKDSITIFADQIIAQSNNQFTKQLDNFNSNSSEQNLKQLFVLKDTIFESLTMVDSFLVSIKNEIDAVSRSSNIENQKQSILKNLSVSNTIFRKKKLALFEEKNYQDYQFKLFTEALAKIITTVPRIKQISGFDSISWDKLKNYPLLYKEVNEMGWSNDLQTICKLLNENIKVFGYIFNDTAIANFSQLKPNEPQPYFALFKAFNALVKKDKRMFIENVKQSMLAISEKDLLASLDLYVALVNSETNSNDEYWELLQNGYHSQLNGSLQEAKLNYDKAEKLSNTGEILFFLIAEVNIKLGDRYSAEIYFKRATTINPKFILPKLYQIEFLTEDKDYETALALVNEAILNNPIWYFYYKKAVLLGLSGKYNEAKLLLLNSCLPMNPLNYEQYLFLGDVCSALTDAKSAREYYMKAGNIKPNDKAYKSKMEGLKQSQEVKPPNK